VNDFSAIAAWLLRERVKGNASPWHTTTHPHSPTKYITQLYCAALFCTILYCSVLFCCQVNDFSAIAAWLLREKVKGAASPWHAYIQSLHKHIPVPFQYPDDLLALSEYPYFINEVLYWTVLYSTV